MVVVYNMENYCVNDYSPLTDENRFILIQWEMYSMFLIYNYCDFSLQHVHWFARIFCKMLICRPLSMPSRRWERGKWNSTDVDHRIRVEETRFLCCFLLSTMEWFCRIQLTDWAICLCYRHFEKSLAHFMIWSLTNGFFCKKRSSGMYRCWYVFTVMETFGDTLNWRNLISSTIQFLWEKNIPAQILNANLDSMSAPFLWSVYCWLQYYIEHGHYECD